MQNKITLHIPLINQIIKGNINPLKCTFCGKDGHSKSHCFKKQVVLSLELKKHNLNVSLSSSSNDTGNAKALSARADLSSSEPEPEWIFDSGATHHMVVHKNLFSSINSCKTKHIFVGNSSPLVVKGKGSVEMKDGMVHNVLYVPKIATNFLSIYQITNSSAGKTALFTLIQ